METLLDLPRTSNPPFLHLDVSYAAPYQDYVDHTCSHDDFMEASGLAKLYEDRARFESESARVEETFSQKALSPLSFRSLCISSHFLQ